MSARAYPPISPIMAARATSRRPTRNSRQAPARSKAKLAAGFVAAVAVWALYAVPSQRWPGYAALRPFVATLSPTEQSFKFGEVSARRGEINGQTVLYVEGSIVNAEARRRKSPTLLITLVGDDGQPLYSWKAKTAKAEMQANADFRTRLLSPPEKFRNIAISFEDAG